MKTYNVYKNLPQVCTKMTGFINAYKTFATIVRPPSFLPLFSSTASHSSSSSLWPGGTIQQQQQHQQTFSQHEKNGTNSSITVSKSAYQFDPQSPIHIRMTELRKSMDFNNLKKLLKSSKHFDQSSSSNSPTSEGEDAITEDERVFLSEEVRESFTEICSSFLGGTWKSIDPMHLKIKHIKGGMTNMLFLCALPESANARPDEHDKTLLRIHFNPETENRLVAESVIFSLLSERQIGPRLYGVFNEGRLEEFIVSDTLTTSDIWDAQMSRRIAKKLALLHRMSLPISKNPYYLIEALERWFIQLKSLRPDLKISCDNKNGAQILTLEDLFEEFQLLKKAISRSTSPVAFCHNDLQEGNILLPQQPNSGSDDIVVIDFEYASYNYRAFDFANHFCEWTFDYTNEAPPNFYYFPEKFPSVKQQENFFQSYLSTIGEMCDEKSLSKIINETSSFVPVSHFFWGVWGLLQNEISPVNFGFTEYGKTRLGIYFDLRSNLLRLLDNKNEL